MKFMSCARTRECPLNCNMNNANFRRWQIPWFESFNMCAGGVCLCVSWNHVRSFLFISTSLAWPILTVQMGFFQSEIEWKKMRPAKQSSWSSSSILIQYSLRSNLKSFLSPPPYCRKRYRRQRCHRHRRHHQRHAKKSTSFVHLQQYN